MTGTRPAKPKPWRPSTKPQRNCTCPEVNGMIRHLRATCTDPVVAELGWYYNDFDGAPSATEATTP